MSPITGNQLANALRALDVNFIMGGQSKDESLPDHFSKELGLHPTDDPEENLRNLAKCHGELSGTWVNWLGTYQHAAQVWQKGLEYKKN